MPDWRDRTAYAPLADADRALVAWEWLRRDPGYRAACRAAGPAASAAGAAGAEARRWGLHALEPCARAVPRARPVWRAAVHPLVLAADAGPPRRAADAFDLSRLAGRATLVPGVAEHLLLCDGRRAVRIDILSGSVRDGPVELRYRLAGLEGAEPALLTLRRLLALARTGRFGASLHPREARARRWILMLRAADGIAAGADQRRLAAILLDAEAEAPHWRANAPSLRLRAQRLARAARLMAAGGYRVLLR